MLILRLRHIERDQVWGKRMKSALKIFDFEVPVECPGIERLEQLEMCARSLGSWSDLKAESWNIWLRRNGVQRNDKDKEQMLGKHWYLGKNINNKRDPENTRKR